MVAGAKTVTILFPDLVASTALLQRTAAAAAKPDERDRTVALLNEALSFTKEHGMRKVQRDAEAGTLTLRAWSCAALASRR